MYNEEQKTKFIRSYTNSINTARIATSLFNNFEKYEEEWGADLCTRSASELQPIVDKLLGLRSKSKWMTLSILKEYARWCMVMKIPGACDGMLNVDSADVEKMRKQMVASPLHLQTCLDKMYMPESEETIDDIYRCYFWMAFSGVEEDDVLSIKDSDLDFDNMVIKYNDRELPIYRESLHAFKNAATLTSFVYFHPRYTKLIRRNRVSGNEIMRGVKSNTKINTIRTTIADKFLAAQDLGIQVQRLSFGRIKLSGLFYRVYEMEQAGMPISFSEAILEHTNKDMQVMTRDAVLIRKQRRLENEYKEDYFRWKLAFHK